MNKNKAALPGFCLYFYFYFFAICGRPRKTGASSSLVARVGSTGFIRVDADSFKSLDARQQELAYWLTQASIAIDPIVYDQFSRFGLRQKRLLEEIAAHSGAIDPVYADQKLFHFAELFWANRGNHNEETSQKFLPEFTFEELKNAALAAQKDGAFKTSYANLPPLATAAQLNKELEDLRPSIIRSQFRAHDHRQESAKWQGHYPGQLEYVLSGRRHAERS